MKKLNTLIFLLTVLIIGGCTSDSEEDDYVNSGGEFNGVWVRVIGASGDETDLAIGNISNEPANRVYMCEKNGSATPGLFKGLLNENVITWDQQYGLPNTLLRRIGEQVEFSYPSIETSIPTIYNRGNWNDDCVALDDSGIKLAVGLNNNLNSWATISYVYIDNTPVPLTLLNSTTTQPDCDSPSSYITLPPPLQIGVNGNGYYIVKVTYSAKGVEGWYTRTDEMAFYTYYFNSGCNIYQVDLNGLNKFSIVPM